MSFLLYSPLFAILAWAVERLKIGVQNAAKRQGTHSAFSVACCNQSWGVEPPSTFLESGNMNDCSSYSIVSKPSEIVYNRTITINSNEVLARKTHVGDGAVESQGWERILLEYFSEKLLVNRIEFLKLMVKNLLTPVEHELLNGGEDSNPMQKLKLVLPINSESVRKSDRNHVLRITVLHEWPRYINSISNQKIVILHRERQQKSIRNFSQNPHKLSTSDETALKDPDVLEDALSRDDFFHPSSKSGYPGPFEKKCHDKYSTATPPQCTVTFHFVHSGGGLEGTEENGRKISRFINHELYKLLEQLINCRHSFMKHWSLSNSSESETWAEIHKKELKNYEQNLFCKLCFYNSENLAGSRLHLGFKMSSPKERPGCELPFILNVNLRWCRIRPSTHNQVKIQFGVQESTETEDIFIGKRWIICSKAFNENEKDNDWNIQYAYLDGSKEQTIIRKLQSDSTAEDFSLGFAEDVPSINKAGIEVEDSQSPIGHSHDERNASDENEETVRDGIVYDRARDPPGQRSIYVPPGNEKQESYRLSTFAKFPLEVPVTPRDLAASGFYYTGYKDRVKCFSCGLCVENWVEGDDVKQARWHRNTCDFINRRECGNIPIGGGIFSRFLGHRGGENVPENRGRQPASQPVQQAPSPVPQRTRNQSPEPMEEGHANVATTSTAQTINPAPRFLAADFRFAEILSAAYETRLRGLDLRHEDIRLTTFDRFPTSPRTVSPEALAKSGFFFLGNLDRVQCFSCGGVLRNWSAGDVVDSEHRRHFGHCKMIRGIETANFPMHGGGDTARRVVHEPADPDPSQIPGLREMFACDNPVNPHMRLESSRLETFDHRWPGGIAATPAQIAKAGFYFLGERDRVKCWYCNGGLQNWDLDDEPWTEHAKWFPICEYVLQRKGPDFVHRIVAEFPNLNRPVINRGYDIPPDEEMGPGFGNGPRNRRPSPPPPIIDPQEEERKRQQKVQQALRSQLVRDVLQMGFPLQDVQKTLTKKITDTGSLFGTADELVEALTLNQDSDEDEEMPSTGSQSTSGSASVSIGPNVHIRNSVVGNRRISTNEPSTSTMIKQPQGAPMDVETISNVSLASNESTETSPSMHQRLKELQEERMCKVCLDKPADIVFVPCGHLCCCYNCASSLRKCPMCRKKIDKSIRTYMS